jgi:hypothetical protein
MDKFEKKKHEDDVASLKEIMPAVSLGRLKVIRHLAHVQSAAHLGPDRQHFVLVGYGPFGVDVLSTEPGVDPLKTAHDLIRSLMEG